MFSYYDLFFFNKPLSKKPTEHNPHKEGKEGGESFPLHIGKERGGENDGNAARENSCPGLICHMMRHKSLHFC
jgi:hypothetical protein